MKRKQMNSVSRSLCEYLMSRNNDIGGYWGLGVLCKIAIRESRHKFSFKIYPGAPIMIYGSQLNDSTEVTEKLIQHNIDSIEGRLSFFPDGRYPDGSQRFTCGIAIAITQGSRTGMYLSHTSCWEHDPSKEIRSTRYIHHRDEEANETVFSKVKKLIFPK